MVYLRYLIMANKPRIRFRGFTEDWEQRKLDDIAKIKTGGGTPKTANPEYWSGNIPWIQSSDLVEGDIVHVNINKFINNNALKNSAAKLISRDSIALVTRVGVGKVAVINQDFTTSQDFLSLSDFDGSDIKFLAYQLYRLMQENAKVLQGTSIKGITKTELIEQSISIPSSGQEQNLISAVLSKIDSIITLHQCKLKKLNLAKKSLLQKLFPRNGSQIPGVRFKGFTDAWEQRKLGDVADVRDGTHDSPKFYNDGFPLVTSKNLKDGSIDFSDCSFISKQDFDEINKRSKVDSGDILFGMIGTIGNPAIVEHTGFAIKNVALIKEGIIVNNRFIYHLLSSKVFDNYIARENAGGTQKFIALNQIRNFIFLAPTLEEQNKIIELLDYISQTITLHQRKLERLQEVKKGLLQKMFV